MKLIDTHCHLYLEEFDSDRESIIDQAIQSGIDLLLLPNVDDTTVVSMLSLCDNYPEMMYPMMGLHPTSVDGNYINKLNHIESYLSKRPYCAIGEIGIDLYWDKSWLQEQKIVFEEQLQWSIDMELPVAIHTRDAFPEVFDSLYKVGIDKLRGVFHSFTGSLSDLEVIKKMDGFKIGINGVVTFKNASLSTVLSSTNIDKIVLETDAPYLSPVPFRGKRNEPIYMWKTAEKVAEIFQLSVEETAQKTRLNALEMFRNIKK